MLATNSPTIYQSQSNLHVPYTMEAAFSVEQQVTKNATVSVTYLNSRGVHQLFMRNANAPLPDRARRTAPFQRPFGNNDNVYQFNSGGVFEENQLITNVRYALGSKISLFGFYALSFANSDLGSGGPLSVGASGGGEASAGHSAEAARPRRSSYPTPTILRRLGTRCIRCSQSRVPRRNHLAALRASAEPVHPREFGHAV